MAFDFVLRKSGMFRILYGYGLLNHLISKATITKATAVTTRLNVYDYLFEKSRIMLKRRNTDGRLTSDPNSYF